jgi:quinol monooxygenase YgiN
MMKGVLMIRKLILTVASILLGLSVTGAQQGGYLDVYIAKVKPEKRAEFDAVSKKMAEANRHHYGDNWITFDAAYGQLNTVIFSSARKDYGDVEKGMGSFEGALGKGLGLAEARTLEQQFDSTLESARTEIRLRRWDLSYNPPADGAAYIQAIGNTRWIRATIIQVRPGHSTEFEAELKELNAASQKSNQPGMRWVSEVTTGGSPWTYVMTRLFVSWGDLDNSPSMQELLGEEGYAKFQKMTAEAVESVDYEVFRVLPELSNPPAEVVAVAPDFWNPRPKPPAKAEKKEPEAKK